MTVQRREIDSHEGDAEQDEDRLGDVGPQQRAERRHGGRDEHDRRDRAGALAAEPCQRAQGEGEDGSKNEGHGRRQPNSFNQAPISRTATLACGSNLPMVKKPWNWPG